MTDDDMQAANDAWPALAFYLKRVLGTSDLYDGFTITPEYLADTFGSIRGDLARMLSQLDTIEKYNGLNEDEYDSLTDELHEMFSLAYIDSGNENYDLTAIKDMLIDFHNRMLRFQRRLDEIKFIP